VELIKTRPSHYHLVILAQLDAPRTKFSGGSKNENTQGHDTVIWLALLVFLPAKSSRADEWNKKTIFTFSAPVEIRDTRHRRPPRWNLRIQALGFAFGSHIVQVSIKMKIISTPQFWRFRITAMQPTDNH